MIFVAIIIFSFIDLCLHEIYGKSLTIEKIWCPLISPFEEGGWWCEVRLNPFFWIISNFDFWVVEPMYHFPRYFVNYFEILINTYFVPLIYWYLLSCLIVWIYKRMMKR
jgi:hypothetical protein